MEIVTLMVACAEHRVAPCTGAAICMVGWHNGLGCSCDGSPGDLTPEDPIFDLDADSDIEESVDLQRNPTLEPYGHMEPDADVHGNDGDHWMPPQITFVQTAEYRNFVMSLCAMHSSVRPWFTSGPAHHGQPQ